MLKHIVWYHSFKMSSLLSSREVLHLFFLEMLTCGGDGIFWKFAPVCSCYCSIEIIYEQEDLFQGEQDILQGEVRKGILGWDVPWTSSNVWHQWKELIVASASHLYVTLWHSQITHKMRDLWYTLSTLNSIICWKERHQLLLKVICVFC